MKIKKKKKIIDSYRTIKLPLDRIINDSSHKEKISNCALRSNKICIKTYQVLKLWILNKYYSNLEIPLITKDTIGMAQKSILKPSRGRKAKNNNLIILKEFQALYPFTLEDGKNLSAILDYQKISILTAIENNIKCHYFDHLENFLTSFFRDKFEKELNESIFKKQFKKNIRKVKNDIINGTNSSSVQFSKHLIGYKNSIIPPECPKEGHYYQIQVNPQRYLKSMIWMNVQIEKIGGKMLHFFPLRNEIIPKYISVDTKSLIEILVPREKNKYLTNIMTYKDSLWNTYFNINNKLKIKGFSFDHTILTDGYSCSVRFIHNDLLPTVNMKKNRMKEGRIKGSTKIINTNNSTESISETDKFQEERIEFPYIDEFDRNELVGNHIFIDPGKRDLLYIIDDKKNRMTYSNKERLKETKRLKYRRIISNLKDQLGISKIENQLTTYNSKTCDLNKFQEFIRVKNETNCQLFSLYENLKFRKYKWYSYINTQRSDDKLVNRIERKFGKDVKIIYGDWSVGKQMRNFISTPNLGIKRKIGKNFKVYNIDEFRTSSLHHLTEEKCENLYLTDIKGKSRKLHSVLTYQLKRKGCINRDYNACLNIRKLFDCYMREEERPIKYRRGTKIIKNTNPSMNIEASNGIRLEDPLKESGECNYSIKKSVKIRKK